MISIEPQACLVELLHADPWKDIVKAGWINSRPNVNPDEVDFFEVLKIDTPVGELAGIVVNLTVPILIREIITTMRDHIMWARTSRVDNLENVWPVHESVDGADLIGIRTLAEQLEEDVAAGGSQDNFRKNLPLSYMTSFTSRFSIRSLIKLIRYFDHLHIHDQCGVMLGKVLNELSNKLSDVLIGIGVEVGRLLEVIKSYDLCPEFDYTSPRVIEGTKNHIIVALKAPLSLRAQVVRHRTLQLADDLISVMRHPMVWTLSINYQVEMEISSTYTIWKSIVSKRNCWLAQSDLWKPIVELVNMKLEDDGFIVPCSDGSCPYEGDCVQRLVKEDPGVPCPRHIHISADDTKGMFEKHIVSLNAYRSDTRDYIKASSRPVEYWMNELELASQVIKS